MIISTPNYFEIFSKNYGADIQQIIKTKIRKR